MNLGSFDDDFGIMFGSFWNHFGIILEPFRDDFGIILDGGWTIDRKRYPKQTV